LPRSASLFSTISFFRRLPFVHRACLQSRIR
jgi:hypothetical protein